MSDDKRTYQANVHLQQSPRLQARRPKGKQKKLELPSGSDMGEPCDQETLPVTQDLILRLIKLLKES